MRELQRRAQKPDKITEIVNAARYLFSSKGYEATSMRDIAEVVGLQAGSLYAHIASKEELLFEIIDVASDRFIAEVVPILTDTDVEVSERLRLAMQVHLRVVSDNLDSATVFFHEWRSLTGERREIALKKRGRYERQFVQLIREGQQSGVFRGIDERFASIGILSLLNWTYTWYSSSGTVGSDELADNFSDLIIEGLATRRRGDGHASGEVQSRPR